MSAPSQESAGEPDGIINNSLVDTQILAGVPVTSSIPSLGPELITSLLRLSVENSALHANEARLRQELEDLRSSKAKGEEFMVRLSTENSVLSAKLDEKSVNETRLRHELEELRNSTAKKSTIIDDPRTFSYFPKLPIELRVEVWRYAAQHPRVLEIRCEKVLRSVMLDHALGRWGNECEFEFRVFNNPPPAVLHANHESRKETLKFYKLGSLNGQQFPTYFNIHSDILYLTFHNAWNLDRWNYTWKAFLKMYGWYGCNVKRVAIEVGSFHDDLPTTIKQCAALGTTELILVDETSTDDPAGEEQYPTTNFTRNFDLIKMSPLDLLKKFVTKGMRYDPIGDGSGIVSVEEFLEEAHKKVEDTVKKLVENNDMSDLPDFGHEFSEDGEDENEENEAGDGNSEDRDNENYSPTITIMRAKFSQSDEKVGKAMNGKRKITMI